MANIDEVEKFLGNMLGEMVTESKAEAYEFTQDVGWASAEIDHWKSRCEELEIELECIKNAFPETDDDILPKHRGLF